MTIRGQEAIQASVLLRDYDLGELLSARRLPGGSESVLKIQTTRGAFVAKPSYRRADTELQARVAGHLNARGIRQAAVVPTGAGAMVTADGYFLQEFLTGEIVLHPSPSQQTAVMRHIGEFHRELADFHEGCLPDADSVWSRVADVDYLLTELPALLARYQLSGEPELACMAALRHARDGLADLPRQVVHGDIGPDNVLMDADAVVSIIDFTPFHESALFGACTALYWYLVYGQAAASRISRAQLERAMTELGHHRPWTDTELALWPAALLREALRRLATPLALAAESAQPAQPNAARRHGALLALADALAT